ncbi:MAG TPA: recombinase family protein [Bryobacteraceae bacterium]|nr:recombinase family protein [Bryobacteraceae bacterium]
MTGEHAPIPANGGSEPRRHLEPGQLAAERPKASRVDSDRAKAVRSGVTATQKIDSPSATDISSDAHVAVFPALGCKCKSLKTEHTYYFYRIGIDFTAEQAHNQGMTKAHAYVRVSGKGQVEGDGFPRQEKAIREYAASNDMKLVRVFREKGVSGTIDSMDRPAWRELMTLLHANGVRTIVIERLDRLARDLMIQEACIADLRRHGFDLVSVQEPDLLSSDPTRVLMRQLMGAVSQYDKSTIVAKLVGARQRKRAKEGRCEGRKPFGHYTGEKLVLDRMKALRAEGLGFDRIAARLNEEGLPTRTGKPWHGVVINRILGKQS